MDYTDGFSSFSLWTKPVLPEMSSPIWCMGPLPSLYVAWSRETASERTDEWEKGAFVHLRLFESMEQGALYQNNRMAGFMAPWLKSNRQLITFMDKLYYICGCSEYFNYGRILLNFWLVDLFHLWSIFHFEWYNNST